MKGIQIKKNEESHFCTQTNIFSVEKSIAPLKTILTNELLEQRRSMQSLDTKVA